ncbi:hypothetical protein [Halorubrum laminariae]|uniref:DUF4142 domain-containing protein n=1 Tax=Halorubrum laminariae TaxID=1433523 RepID=A0ABD6C042_9EURY|nr:hypothetical protein [Halorubrum laminariae]
MKRRRVIVSSASFAGLATFSGCLDGVTGGDGSITGGGDGVDDDRREIARTYDDALVARNDAVTARDEGVSSFNDEAYPEAIDSIEAGLVDIEEAESMFAESATLAREITEETAAEICELSAEEVRIQTDATEAALSAARAADEGESAETINGHIETFRSHRDEAEALTVEDTDAVVSALGLE